MHIIFTSEELEWINTRSKGWPIKKNCPPEIRKSIERKKQKLEKEVNHA